MKINEPQRFHQEHFKGVCPFCASDHIHLNGEIDVPPLMQQFQDARRGVRREWKSLRYFCPACNEIFDVVQVNRVLSEGEAQS